MQHICVEIDAAVDVDGRPHAHCSPVVVFRAHRHNTYSERTAGLAGSWIGNLERFRAPAGSARCEVSRSTCLTVPLPLSAPLCLWRAVVSVRKPRQLHLHRRGVRGIVDAMLEAKLTPALTPFEPAAARPVLPAGAPDLQRGRGARNR